MAESQSVPENQPTEIPDVEVLEGFPPYPSYPKERAPPSLADTIFAGRDIRVQHKSVVPTKSVKPPPKPARPKGPKATDIKLSKRAARAHARCLRKQGVLTERLEFMSKPPRRAILNLWRQYANSLPADTIARLRAMLDADEPHKPDQAYEYFVNMRKTKNKNKIAPEVKTYKRDITSEVCGEKRFLYARNATVAFAIGILQRLSRPGTYALSDGMFRLSNIILEEVCNFMQTRKPGRRSNHPKAKFMIEMSDKVAVWIDEILSDSEDRMLMMDFDEDEVLDNFGGGDMGFADDFLNMIGDGGHLKEPQPAYLKFTGDMYDSFIILTDSMYEKDKHLLMTYGKVNLNYKEAADVLKETDDFEATEYNTTIANKLKIDLQNLVKAKTPDKLALSMNEMVDICSSFLAQHLEFNKDKGPAFQMLVKAMHAKKSEGLYQKGKVKRTYTKGAVELEKARGLDSSYDDPNLSQEVHSKLSKLIQNQTTEELKSDMTETLDKSAKYLSQRAIDEAERGPAFDVLIKELERKGGDEFTPQYPPTISNFDAAYALKSAPGLSGVQPDPATSPKIAEALQKNVKSATPTHFIEDMRDVIKRSADYLSGFIRDRKKAMEALIDMMKRNSTKELVTRNIYTMDYKTGATEITSAPVITPYMPIKDIADEIKEKLTKEMEGVASAPPDLALKTAIHDVSQYLSQPVAVRSEVAGERYPLKLLAAAKHSLGERPLLKHKAYGQTYAEAADVLKQAGPLEHDPKAENLQQEILSEMNRGVSTKLAPTMVTDLNATMEDASKHIAKIGSEKGEALQDLVNAMKKEGEVPLGKTQKSYIAGAERLETAPSLKAENVDKAIYESIRRSLSDLLQKTPSVTFQKQMPVIVDESAKFLASPVTDDENDRLIPKPKEPEIVTTVSAVVSPPVQQPEPIEMERDEKPKKESIKAPADLITTDVESEHARNILLKQLKARGAETFYKQSHTELTHSQATEWLSKPELKVDKSVKESGDTSRLHKKFEKKLYNIVSKETPPELSTTMQDVIIESARNLSENFVSDYYKALVRLILISEMQKRGNEILTEEDNSAETYFFAAQRIKKTHTLEVDEPCNQMSYQIAKKLDDMIKRQSMPRKLTFTMRDHTKDAADYLSTVVNTPDEEIEAYVALLNEMEGAGDSLLIEGDIPKSYKESAFYLRQLISNEDDISLPNSTLQGEVERKLKDLMSKVTPLGYSKSALGDAITKSTKRLVSYIMLQGKKTEALKCLVKHMDPMGDNVLLRHGAILKSYKEGANILRSKNTDQLRVFGADPVVTRKIQLKLNNLMDSNTPEKYKPHMDDVIEDAITYLAVYLLTPQTVQVCICAKNAFVQCELRTDETLRHIGRPSCTCSRHISAQTIAALDPIQHVLTRPCLLRKIPRGLDISIQPCSSIKLRQDLPSTSKSQPNEIRKTRTSLALFSTAHLKLNNSLSYNWLQSKTQYGMLQLSTNKSLSTETTSTSYIETESNHLQKMQIKNKELLPNLDKQEEKMILPDPCSDEKSNLPEIDPSAPFWKSRSAYHVKIHSKIQDMPTKLINDAPSPSNRQEVWVTQHQRGNDSRASIITTDQMVDWQAMMTSLMWNIQAWRVWVQEIVNRTLKQNTPGETIEMWPAFYRRVATESLQWRHYSNFSRQLVLRLALRYRDRQIVSPTRGTVKNEMYMKCHEEMLNIIEMFDRLTRFIANKINITNIYTHKEMGTPTNEMTWKYFYEKIEDCVNEWTKLNAYFNTFWDLKYRSMFFDMAQPSSSAPVWVVSAYGTVPSGAVSAGESEGEVIWVARTTHNSQVLPAALIPSKQCCIVYADGAIHHYTKYQVLCNVDVKWIACRAEGASNLQAIGVSHGVLAGRVLYRSSHLLGAVLPPAHRCHVIIFGRRFAFNCYELLVYSDTK